MPGLRLGLVGDVRGPGSTTDNALVRFDGTDGKTLQSSSVTVDDSGNISGATLTVTALTSGSVASITNADSPYTVPNTARYVLVDTSSGVITINLPNPASRGFFTIKDIGGALETNNLTLARFGSEKIETLAANKILSTNLGAWTVVTNGTDWFLV